MNNYNNSQNNKNKIISSIIYTCLFLALTAGAYIFGTISSDKKHREERKEQTSSIIKEESSSITGFSSITSDLSSVIVSELPEISISPVKVEEITDKKILKYIDPEDVHSFYKGKKYYKSVKEYYEVEILLYKDNSYIMTTCFMACNASRGTYTLEEDKIILKQTLSYGSDACYYRENETIKYNMTGESISYVTTNNDDKITVNETSLKNIKQIINEYEMREYESEDCTDKTYD